MLSVPKIGADVKVFKIGRVEEPGLSMGCEGSEQSDPENNGMQGAGHDLQNCLELSISGRELERGPYR